MALKYVFFLFQVLVLMMLFRNMIKGMRFVLKYHFNNCSVKLCESALFAEETRIQLAFSKQLKNIIEDFIAKRTPEYKWSSVSN